MLWRFRLRLDVGRSVVVGLSFLQRMRTAVGLLSTLPPKPNIGQKLCTVCNIRLLCLALLVAFHGAVAQTCLGCSLCLVSYSLRCPSS